MNVRKIAQMFTSSNMSLATQASTIGLHLVSGIAVGCFFGYLLDKWFKTGSKLFILFALLGVVAGFRNVYIDTKRLIQKEYGEDRSNDPENGEGNSNDPQ